MLDFPHNTLSNMVIPQYPLSEEIQVSQTEKVEVRKSD